MKKISVVTILLFFISAHFSHAEITPTEPSDEYMSLVDQASKASRKGNWNDADSMLTLAMQLQPQLPTNILLMSNLGMIRFYAGNDSLALATLNMAHDMAPNSVTILSNRAKVLTYLNRKEEAIADYTSIVQLDTTITDAYFNRAILSLQKADIETATSDVERLMSLSPKSEKTIEAAAYLSFARNEFAATLSLITPLIEKSPTSDLLSIASFCHLMLGNLAEASDMIARGLQSDPTHAELYLYRGLLNKMRFRPDDAIVDAKRAVELGIPIERATKLLDVKDLK